MQHNRRDFLKLTATTGGGLLLGFNFLTPKRLNAAVITATDAEAMVFNAYLSINPNGTATIFSPNPEVGQGIKTSFPITVAEELDIDWQMVKVAQSPLDAKQFERQVAVARRRTRGNACVRRGQRRGKCSWKRRRNGGKYPSVPARRIREKCFM